MAGFGTFYAVFTDDGLQPGAEYREKVLTLDPEGKGDALRGSLAWLVASDVISEADREASWKTKIGAQRRGP